jgi:predicted DNA-binding transcriptional regulator AlpA
MMKLVNDVEASAILGMSAAWLRRMRVIGGGPSFVKLGNATRYDLEDLQVWVESRKCRSTSDEKYKRARQADDLVFRPKGSKSNIDIETINSKLRGLDHEE